MTPPLNAEQEKAAKLIISGHNVLLMGQCGTGKTFTSCCAITNLIQSKKSVAVCATTGMASLHYKKFQGTTVHHWAGLGDLRFTKERLLELLLNDDLYVASRKRIQETEVLFLDEVSMLSCRAFETLEYVCRNVRGNGCLFGGLQVVFSGDFKQLPPVPNLYHDDEGKYCFQSPLFSQVFPHHVNLTEVVRQHQDDLVKAVNELCAGCPSPETEKLMTDLNRELPQTSQPVRLFGTNFDVDYLNQDMLDDLPGELKVYSAEDEGEKALLRRISAPKSLALKDGAPVILLRNLTNNLCNGMRGIVQRLDEDGPIVDFAGNLVKLDRVNFECFDSRAQVIRCSRAQFPLKLAFALTVHRAQGQTISVLEIDCSSFFAPGQLGVAVGRATCKEGLRIVHYNASAARLQHPLEVYEFYDRPSKAPMADLKCCQGQFPDLPNCVEIHVIDSDQDENQPPSNFDVTGNDTQFATDNVCPWNLHDFKSTLKVNASAFNPNDKNVISHANALHAKTLQWMPRNVQRQDDWVKTYTQANTFLLSEEHISLCKFSFSMSPVSKQVNKLSSKLLLWLIEQEVKKLADPLIRTQQSEENQALQNPSTSDSSAGDAKLRYIGGACISTMLGRLRTSVLNTIGRTGKNITNKRRLCYQKQQLLKQLRITEADATALTTSPQSLAEIEFRQGASRGLLHVDDRVLQFFKDLNSFSQAHLTSSSFHLHGQAAYHTLKLAVLNNSSLLDKWLLLFSSEPGVDSPIDDELRSTLLVNLFDATAEHFIKVAFVEGLHSFKESIPKKKKQALRTKIQALGERKSPKKIKLVSTENAEDGYYCNICKTVCEEDPCSKAEDSIACDSCNFWFHFQCVGLSGSEKFLNNSNSTWKCQKCKNAMKSKGKGKKQRN